MHSHLLALFASLFYTRYALNNFTDLVVTWENHNEYIINYHYWCKLLEELENHFEGKGFNNINLVTSDFSAPGFYKKCGFTVEFIRENKINPKFTKTFFIKYFKNKHQTQRILKTP